MNYQSRIKADQTVVVEKGLAPRRRWGWIVAAVALVVIAAATAFFFFNPAGGADKTAAASAAKGGKRGGGQAPTVTVSVPGRQTVQRIVSATGTLAARRELPVGVNGEGGMIQRVLVEPGQWVRQGQVLATIERSVQVQQNASMAAQVTVARADANLAQAELDRARQLVERGFISKADIDRKTATRDAAIARVRVAQAQSGEMRARTGRLDIRAPAAGLVLTRAAEPGQIVSAGSGVLFRMARGGEMELRAALSEADLARMTVGARATVTPVGATESFDGEIWQLSPIIDAASRQGVARIALRYNAALRPGGFASTTIIAGAQDAPLLPESAVQSDDKGNFVYLVNAKNEVERRAVTVGDVSDRGVVIAQGLTGQERVVISAGAFLNPGQKINPILKRMAGSAT